MTDQTPTPPAAEQPWYEAGCSRRSCQNGHSHRWGYCAYAEEPVEIPILFRWATWTGDDGTRSFGTEKLTSEQVADWLRDQGYAVAQPRASAPGRREQLADRAATAYWTAAISFAVGLLGVALVGMTIAYGWPVPVLAAALTLSVPAFVFLPRRTRR